MEAGPMYLEHNTSQSLHQRFSEVLLEQLTQRRFVFRGNKSSSMVLRLRNTPHSQLRQGPQLGHRASVWSRLGWKKRGFWNFRNKYRRRVSFSKGFSPAPGSNSAYRWINPALRCLSPALRSRLNLTLKRGALRGVLRHRRTPLFKGKSFQVSKWRGQASSRGRGQQKVVPSKKQLDLDLDWYMSKTKTRLDAQLDQYMSLSRSRLDAQLDQYMSMAGEEQWA
ncbi:unnamed protein product [Knipowitschia caucasica]|uniref:Chromatin target of PRMT1 protein C-terminal domain-containing protein n=1 Tax=Knipowitschia caucasica TaxID=637954 RepID=A0AAV2MEE3_KNICA